MEPIRIPLVAQYTKRTEIDVRKPGLVGESLGIPLSQGIEEGFLRGLEARAGAIRGARRRWKPYSCVPQPTNNEIPRNGAEWESFCGREPVQLSELLIAE